MFIKNNQVYHLITELFLINSVFHLINTVYHLINCVYHLINCVYQTLPIRLAITVTDFKAVCQREESKVVRDIKLSKSCGIDGLVTTVPLGVSYGGAKPLSPFLGPLTSFPGV